MKLIVLYFVVIQNCLQIVLSQETQTSDYVTENFESSTTSVTHKDEINPVEVNKPHYDSLSGSNPTHDEEAKNDLDYPFKTLKRLLKVKGSVTDSFDGASKIFDGMQDVGGELFGMVKDGALNFAAKDSERESGESIGNNISNVLKEVSKYCNTDSNHRPPFMPSPLVNEPPLDLDYHNFQTPDVFHDQVHPIGYYPYRVDNYVEEYRVPNHGVPFQYSPSNISPSRRMQILQQQYGELPIVTGTNELVNIVNNNQVSMVRIPESMVMNLVTPDQLSVLYQNNQAFDVPSMDPSAPRLIAMTTRILSSILKAKKRFHNVIDHGVAGAENLFGGLHETAGGIAELIGGGAHGLLDFIV